MIYLLLVGSIIDITFGQTSTPILSIRDGDVRGLLKESRNGRTYWSFVGIPFAKPPIGQYRFANPIRPDPWHGVLNATEDAPRCLQRNYFFSVQAPPSGSEDCLYINVYVPQVANRRRKKMQVMASIFWGGFAAGGGDTGLFDPSYFMDYDVIVVTFNYRLGVFGFLSTFDDESPGNYALKDQVLALKWIQENIEYFGGSKENVTIMGESAGASSVHYHMLSPSSNGLFTKGISQSGTSLALWAYSTDEIQRTVTRKQTQLVGCSYALKNSAQLISCLRKVPSEELLQTQDAFKVFYQFPYQPWAAVTEKKTSRNPEPFLTQPVEEYLQKGEFKKIPWLVGTCKDEGLLYGPALLTPDQARNDLNNSFQTIMPKLLALSTLTNDINGLFRNISKFYLRGRKFLNIANQKWLNGFFDLLADRLVVQSIYKSISLQLSSGHNSIYLYSFEYSGEYSVAKYLSTQSLQYNTYWGVSHADDLVYLWNVPNLFPPIVSINDISLSKILLQIWTKFAITGDPNGVLDFTWNPLAVPRRGKKINNKDIRLLNITGNYLIGANFKLTRGYYPKRMAFWDKV